MDRLDRWVRQTPVCLAMILKPAPFKILSGASIFQIALSVLKRCLCLAEKNNSKTECKIRFILK